MTTDDFSGEQGHAELDFLSGGGEMGALMREKDWSKTSIGPIETWSQSLRTTVSILLANRFPLLLWWGPQYASIYNDAYRPILGRKHPMSLGQPVSECWEEIWHVLQPLIDTPFNGGPATWMDDILLEINRYGFVEETHFTIAYSPVPDETTPNGIGGVLATVHEISEKVVGERRIKILRDLGVNATDAKTAEEACVLAAETMAKHPKDVPFALLYLIDPDGEQAHLEGASGVERDEQISPLVVELHKEGAQWPFAEALQAEDMQTVEDLRARFRDVPPGPWPAPPHSAVVIPIPSNKAHQFVGFLVAGISPRLQFEDQYRSLFELLTSQISTAIANARVYEEERKRAEALAEIDRAKTLFFSNVSHEFHTPLTLMLGPIEDALANGMLPPQQQEQLDVAHRNSLRLLRLVNSLLDFSRIEAGRIQAVYEPTDLADYTRDLASSFRSAIERAGMRLIVDTPALEQPVYVDREMWEKIVLNLLSNAFKYTLEGEITVSLRQKEDTVELAVIDTGVGIPEEELPHMFERFHRVRGVEGRTYEGSGIGLSLVRELVTLHGGAINVESVLGEGSAFTVSIPLGTAHLPEEKISSQRTLASTATGTQAYLEEALRLLPGYEESSGIIPDVPVDSSPEAQSEKQPGNEKQKARILFADDNADMREYVQRLLSPKYDVEAVPDGRAALSAIKERQPDLVLADVMMPGLDGFGLLDEIRKDENTSTLPVIMLSARAGEEASVEGMEAGADDYLVKPFSAREFLARVYAHLEMARMRKEAEEVVKIEQERLSTLFRQAPAAIAVVSEKDRTYQMANHLYQRVFNRSEAELVGKTIPEVFPEVAGQGIYELFDTVFESGEAFVASEFPATFDRLNNGSFETGFFNFVLQPITDKDEKVESILIHAFEVTEQVKARQKVEESEARLEAIVNQATAGIAQVDLTGKFIFVNERYSEITGRSLEELSTLRMQDITHPDDLPNNVQLFKYMLETGQNFVVEKRYIRKDASHVWVNNSVSLIKDVSGKPQYALAVTIDVTQRKEDEQKLHYLATLTQNVKDAVIGTDTEYNITSWNKGAEELYGWKEEEVVGKYAGKVIPTEFLSPDTRKEWQESLAVKGYWAGEVIQKRKDGTPMPVLASTSSVKDSDGNLIGAVAVNRDITERKQTEEALAEVLADSEQQKRLYEAIMGSTPDLIYVFDLNYRFTYANEALLTMWGRTWEESIGKSLLEIGYEPWHAEMHEREIGQVVATKQPVRGEVPFIHHTLGRRIYDYIFVPVLNDKGEVEAIAGTTRDITERTRTEEALRESEERFRALTTASSDVVYRMSPDWSEMRQLEGRNFLADTGEPICDWLQKYIHPDDQQRVMDVINEAVRTKSIFELEHQVRQVDGTLGWAFSRAIPILDKDGEIVEWFGAASDITERKQVDELRDTIISMVSHELRTPIHHVRGYASSLLQTDIQWDEKTRLDFIRGINQETVRLSNLVSNILEMSRLGAGETSPLNLVPIRPTDLVESGVEEASFRLKEQQLSVEVSDALPNVVADPARIKLVFTNLLDNAAKYSPAGSRIRVSARPGEGEVVFSIEDEGPGIPDEERERIFERFTRLYQAGAPQVPGTGLGLAICRLIVTSHNGRIWVDSKSGGGSIFSFTLPVAP